LLYFLFYIVFLTLGTVSALNNGLGRKPQMGWNSWNYFKCNVTEDTIHQTIDYIAQSGLAIAGYVYVNIDDCWAGSRATDGTIIPDQKTFPNGIKPLADHAHSLGLKFGLYSDAGYRTCAGRPGSLGYENIDAKTYASWEVDYLKYDNCFNDGTKPEVRYPVMRDALNASGRLIFYSMCDWGVDNPATWGAEVGNSWRTTGDIRDTWDSMISNAEATDKWWSYAGPGGWNDPDMLEVGNGGMTVDQYRAHFSLWCLMKAPLLIGCDVSRMKDEIFAILTNAEAIAVNQDPLGIQGHKVKTHLNSEVWAGPLANHAYVVVLLNVGLLETNITATWSDIGIPNGSHCVLRDLWQHRDLGTFSDSIAQVVAKTSAFMGKLTCMS